MSEYHLPHARSDEQAAKMRLLTASDSCLFCDGELSGDWPIMDRTRHWVIARNQFPYKGAKHHVLLVPSDHVTDLLDISAAAKADFWPALELVQTKLELTDYSIGARCGDCAVTGGTIAHVHVHLVVGDGSQPVSFKMSAESHA